MQGYDRKPEEFRSLWRPRLMLEDNIEMEVKTVGWECLGWFIGLRIRTSSGLLWRQYWTFRP